MADAMQDVLTETRGRVGIVTFNRPERMNAWSAQMLEDLKVALRTFDADPQVGAIVVTGSGRAFSAGADVKNYARVLEGSADAISDAKFLADPEPLSHLLDRIKPVVAAINGYAVGVGLTMTLSADYRIASEQAKLSVRFAAMGIVPSLGGTWLLADIVGTARARDLILTGAFIDAATALQIGLVAEVVPHEDLLDRAVAKADEYARNAPEVTRMVKQVATANRYAADRAAMEQRENEATQYLKKRPAHAEAVRALAEKREPDFYGTAEG